MVGPQFDVLTKRFDEVARAIATPGTRRFALRALTGSILTFAGLAALGSDAEADSCTKKCKKKEGKARKKCLKKCKKAGNGGSGGPKYTGDAYPFSQNAGGSSEGSPCFQDGDCDYGLVCTTCNVAGCTFTCKACNWCSNGTHCCPATWGTCSATLGCYA